MKDEWPFRKPHWHSHPSPAVSVVPFSGVTAENHPLQNYSRACKRGAEDIYAQNRNCFQRYSDWKAVAHRPQVYAEDQEMSLTTYGEKWTACPKDPGRKAPVPVQPFTQVPWPCSLARKWKGLDGWCLSFLPTVRVEARYQADRARGCRLHSLNHLGPWVRLYFQRELLLSLPFAEWFTKTHVAIQAVTRLPPPPPCFMYTCPYSAARQRQLFLPGVKTEQESDLKRRIKGHQLNPRAIMDSFPERPFLVTMQIYETAIGCQIKLFSYLCICL